jgi:hypothetical protein
MIVRTQDWKNLLLKKVQEVQQESKATIQKVAEKRKRKAEDRDSQQTKNKDSVPNFGVSKLAHCIGNCTDIDKSPKSVVNYKVVQEWLIVAMMRNNMTWVPAKLAKDVTDEKAKKSWWNAKDIKLVSELIKLYEGEQIKKAIDWL